MSVPPSDDPNQPPYQGYPSYPQYPGGGQQYPGGQPYPGGQQYPGGQPYPGGQQYPGSQQYPGGQQYQGYPQYPGYQQPSYGAGYAPADPLVTAPNEGFSGWWSRLWTSFGRSWRTLVPIVLLTIGLPGALFQLFYLAGTNSSSGFELHAGFLLVAFLALVLTTFATAIGYGAAMYTVIRDAASPQTPGTPIGDALSYGVRNMWRLWGWGLLVGLMILAGTCACVLPGIYLGVAASLYVPVALLQPGSNPIGESFRLVNRNLGMALGRILLLFLGVLVAGAIFSSPGALIGAISPGARPVSSAIGELIASVSYAVVGLGILLTFAELRGREMPITTANLAAAL